MTKGSKSLKSNLWFYEVLLSLSLGLAVAGVVIVRDLILWPFVPIYRALSPVLTYPGGLNLATDIAFVSTALMYAAFIWLVLHASARSPLTQHFLFSWSGSVLFVAPWLSWMLMAAGHSLVGDALLAIETAICTFSACYLPRKSRGLDWHVWFIVTLNWCVWAWAFWRGIPNHAPTLIPIAAALSSVVWLLGRNTSDAASIG
jgi:hypothetical protein